MILYFDCFSGISGNMTIGAMLNLGVDFEQLKTELAKLNLTNEYELIFEKTEKCGIAGSYFNVKLLNSDNHHEHSHSHEHGHCTHNCSHDHSHHHHEVHNHSHDHSHRISEHSHEHSHSHAHHSHSHRNLTDIHTIIDESGLNDSVKVLSKNIFQFVANAESKIHNKSFDELHFHEVGAIDSIIDIVGTAICLDILQPEKIFASPVAVGSGFVECAHGKMPVPAPATAEIIKEAGIPIYAGTVKAELTTPTGAAILASCVNEFCELPNAKIDNVSYGAGSHNFEIPNLLRIYSLSESKIDAKKKE